jgi:hypothetical protein
MDRKPTLEDLLALRDGELGDPERERAMLDDPGSREALARLREIKAALNHLPTVAPGAEVWEGIERRIGSRGPRLGRAWRAPLATAASVLLAATLALLWWDPAMLRDRAGDMVPAESGLREPAAVEALIQRSGRLESALFASVSIPAAQYGSTGQALVYAIADVDVQLAELGESGTADVVEYERLWGQRVMLLEALAEAQWLPPDPRQAVYVY